MQKSIDILSESPNPYRVIADRLKVPANAVVYYPCSGSDDCPREGFPHHRVICADQNADDMALLAEKGCETHVVDVCTFEPTSNGVDVLILQNPALNALEFVDTVKGGGLVIANNWHGSAGQVNRQPNMDLVAVMTSPTHNPRWLDTDIAGCFEMVSTDQELDARGLLAKYQALVDKYASGTIGNSIVDRYQALYAASYDTMMDDHIVMDATSSLGYVSLPQLPKKKAFADGDLAIFRKKNESEAEANARKVTVIQNLIDVLPEEIGVWFSSSLAKLLGITIDVTTKTALHALLVDTKLKAIKLAIIEHVTEYFQKKASIRSQFLAIVPDKRWQIPFSLEQKFGLRGDPDFAAEVPQEVLDVETLFIADQP
jgi:hypothetical protein